MEANALKWFEDVICNGLGIQQTVFHDFAKSNGEILSDFVTVALGSDGSVKWNRTAKVLIFYCIQQEEEVEVVAESLEESVEEEEDDLEGLSLAESDSDEEEIVTLKTGTPVSSYEDDLASTYISYTTSSGQELSEYSSSDYVEEENFVEYEPVGQPKKKIVKQLVTKTVLRVSADEFPSEGVGQSILYVTAIDTPNKSPWKEGETNFIKYFEVYDHCIRNIHPIPTSENNLAEDENLIEKTKFTFSKFKTFLDELPVSLSSSQDPYNIINEDISEDLSASDIQALVKSWNEKLKTAIKLIQVDKPEEIKLFNELLATEKEQFGITISLLEQLRSKPVEINLNRLKADSIFCISEHIEIFENQLFVLEGLSQKIEQTLKILALLERLLHECQILAQKNIYEKSMISIAENLIIFWFVSRRFGDVKSYSHLFKVVTKYICDEALKQVDFSNIRQVSNAEVLNNLRFAIEFLLCWESVITTSNDKTKSEMSSPTLNETISVHVAHVLQDFSWFFKVAIDVVNASDDINVVKGDEDKLIESRNTLLQPIFELEFVIFDPYYKDSWDKSFRKLKKQLNNTKQSLLTPRVVEESTRDLEKCLLVIQRLRLDALIQDPDKTKDYQGLLSSFLNEVIYLESTIQNAITLPKAEIRDNLLWINSTIQTVENGLAQFATSKDVCHSPKWSDVKSQCDLILVKIIASRGETIAQWQKLTELSLPILVSQSLLIKFDLSKMDFSISAESTLMKEIIISGREIVQVNYPVQLKQIITEAKILRSQRFNLSEGVVTLILMEHDILCYENELRQLFLEYSKLLNKFPSEQLEIVLPIFKDIDKIVKMGCKNMTWCSISTPEYIKDFKLVLESTSVIAQYIDTVLNDMEKCRGSFKEANLLELDELSSFPIYKNFAERQNENKSIVDYLIKNYKNISYCLIKLENLIHKSETGCCKELNLFYLYWQEIIYQELTLMVKGNLKNVLNTISSGKQVFEVKLVLIDKELTFEPPLPEILKSILFTVMDIVKSTDNFARWLKGMCITINDISVDKRDEFTTTNSFYSDINQDADILSICKDIEQSIHSDLDNLEQSVTKLENFRYLWSLEPETKCQQFSKDSSKTSYYNNFKYFTSLKLKFENMASKQKFGCLILSFKDFQNKMKVLIDNWTKELGMMLYDVVEQNLADLHNQLKEILKTFDMVGDTAEKRNVLKGNVKNVAAMMGSVEQSLRDYEEKLRIISQFEIVIYRETWSKIKKVSDTWQQILKCCRIFSAVLWF